MANVIEIHEENLQQAMLFSDIEKLDILLSSELIFTNHIGQVISKQDDIDAHKSGVIRFEEISLDDQKIIAHDELAIVTVQASIVGFYKDVKSNGTFRFTRVWRKKCDDSWKVIVGHSSLVN